MKFIAAYAALYSVSQKDTGIEDHRQKLSPSHIVAEIHL